MTKPIFQITETEEGLRKMMAEFGENELVPLSKSLATTHEFCAETYWQIRRQLGALGVLVMDIPSEYGGADAPGILACVPAEEVAAIDFGFSHQWVPASLVIPTIFYYGTEEQKKKWLPGLASGEMFGAYCQTEPDAGSDVSSIRCWAEQDENGDYILTGNTSKIFVSMGATDQSTPADVLLVMAKTSREGSPHKSLSMLLVDGKEAFQNGQLVVSKFEEKIGAHQTSTVELNFNNCKAELIGEPNKGFPIAMNALTASRVGVAVQATGIAKGAYRIAEKYATEQRTQFDRFIADLSAPAKYLEEMRAKIMISDLLSRRAITRKEQCPHKRGVDIVYEASTAKRVNAQLATEVADRAVQLLGGHGYMLENIVPSMWASARLMQIYEGTDEIQELLIFGDILKRAGEHLGILLLLKKSSPWLMPAYRRKLQEIATIWPFYPENLEAGKYNNEITRLRKMQLDSWVQALPIPEELNGVRPILANRSGLPKILSRHFKGIVQTLSIPYGLHANSYSHALLDGATLLAEAFEAGYCVGNGHEMMVVTETDVETALRLAENAINRALSYS